MAISELSGICDYLFQEVAYSHLNFDPVLNFLINWPGFLIFMPAINGYIYEANYDVEVTLTEAAGDSKIDTWSIPIRLNLRHAAMNRTWTEVGWFMKLQSILLISVPLSGAGCCLRRLVDFFSLCCILC